MAPPSAPIAPGDLVCLAPVAPGRDLARPAGRAEDDARVLVRAEGAPRKLRGLGVLAPERLVGQPWGARFEHGSRAWRLLRPSVADLTSGLARKAQIVLPKDAARIVFECDVRAGSRVAEAGIGSGALTTALAWACAPTGRVHAYELRDDFAEHARRNLEESGLLAHVDIKVRDVAKGIDERDLDAVVLDMPNPWDAVPAAKEALRGDGHFAAYSPLVSQVERTHKALAEAGFHEVRTLEVIERPWVVHEHGARPAHEILAHTAFLTFARKG